MPYLILKGIGLDGHLVKRAPAKALERLAPGGDLVGGGVPQVVLDFIKDYCGDKPGYFIPTPDGPIKSLVYMEGTRVDGTWEIADAPPPKLRFAPDGDGSVALVPDGGEYRVSKFYPLPSRPRYRAVLVRPGNEDLPIKGLQGDRGWRAKAEAQKACQTHLDIGYAG